MESRVLTSTDSALTNCNALQVFLQEVQEEAVQAALTVYNSEAVGGGPTRQKYEKQLHITLKRQFQDYKRKSSLEAELKCLRAVDSMDERLRNACIAPNATFDSVVKVGNSLIFPYLSVQCPQNVRLL
jgi:hypothetical protein